MYKQNTDHFNEAETNFLKVLIAIAGGFIIIMFFVPIFYISSKPKKPVKKEVLMYQADIITYNWNDSVSYVLEKHQYYDVKWKKHHKYSKKGWLEINNKAYNKNINIKSYKIENPILTGVKSIEIN